MDLESSARLVIDTLKEALSGFELSECALSFSGGLDSSLLMRICENEPVAYTVGFPGSKDFENSEKVSSLMGFNPWKILLSDDIAKQYTMELVSGYPDITIGELGYELVLYTILKNVNEEYVIVGQGADELFYGYKRLINSDFQDNSTHLRNFTEKTLPREYRMASNLGKELVAPFADLRIINIARSIDRSLHTDGIKGKLVLRRAARILGLADDICSIEKKAAQYGSGTEKWLRKNFMD
ncbi:MAG: asparagine synthase-related protein [Candidatus Thermoplasmatota archaeon]|jgi:asparagine synthase (glutamine-hydrolysing)|nr:asparagine synthase-related protein [Candidatus Thermoplasmatota archaeon]MCL5794539.1 asparagine synthase-related protein [Candidatus Thermoplasmatota archaeon]